MADSQVPPNDGKRRIERRGLLPKRHRLAMTPLVIEQIAEIIAGARVTRICFDRKLQYQHLFKAAWKTVVRRRFGRRRERLARAAPEFCFTKCARVEWHRRAGSVEEFESFFVKAGAHIVERDIQPRSLIARK